MPNVFRELLIFLKLFQEDTVNQKEKNGDIFLEGQDQTTKVLLKKEEGNFGVSFLDKTLL